MGSVARLLLAFVLFACFYPSQAQRVQVRAATRLVYEVDDRGKKYKYIVTVNDISNSTQVLEWKTDGKIVYKGKSINEVVDPGNADRLLIKPNMESEERINNKNARQKLYERFNLIISLRSEIGDRLVFWNECFHHHPCYQICHRA